MCRLFISMLLTLAVLSVQAVTVQCEPGKLSTLLANRTVTELTVLGSMDARDFKYIVEHQRQVTSLNLFSVSVVSHHSNKPLYANVRDYKADELPTMALAQLTHLKQLTLPAQVTTIGEGALAACTSLTTVTLPQELRSLGKYAFAGCTALTTVALPSRLITIDDGAFAQCTALTTVTLAQPISPNPGTSPFEQAPANVRHVGSKAFEGCIKLKSVALGNQVQTIGDAAFAGTKLTSADLSGMTMLTQVGDWAYAQTNITQAALPNTTTELGRGAFMLNPSLTHVTLPNKLATLSPLTLAGSSQLSDIDLRQSSIDTIGAYALYNLSHVSHIVLPASTQYLGDKAMAGMTGLEQITTYASSVPELGEDVWDGVDQPSVVLKVPANSADYYLSADQWRLFNIQLSSLLGDVNDDGLIDIADLNAIINYMLGSPNIVFIFDAADIDQNGEIDISDVNGIINLMLGKIMAMPSSVEPNTTDALNIDNFAIAAGERHTIDVLLDDTRTYTSLQCVIHLPQGLSLVDGTVVVGQRTVGRQEDFRCPGGYGQGGICGLSYNGGEKDDRFSRNEQSCGGTGEYPDLYRRKKSGHGTGGSGTENSSAVRYQLDSRPAGNRGDHCGSGEGNSRYPACKGRECGDYGEGTRRESRKAECKRSPGSGGHPAHCERNGQAGRPGYGEGDHPAEDPVGPAGYLDPGCGGEYRKD